MPLPQICARCGVHNPSDAVYCECGFELTSSSSQISSDLSNQDQITSPSANPSVSEQTFQPTTNYFMKHWRGELSLGVSYWVNYWLFANLAALPLYVIPMIDSHISSITEWPKLYSLLIVAAWGFVILITPWQCVGVWRSALQHIQKTGRYFWARTAQFVVVISILASINVLVETAIPQVREYLLVALGMDRSSKYSIRVLRQGTELEVLGGIGFGLTEDVKKQYNANPNLKVIHLNSEGGRVAEGRKLRDFIFSHNLMTYSSRGCFSACTLAFMGGTSRFLKQDAQLGFHQWSFPGIDQKSINEALSKIDKDSLRSAGVSPGFIEKVFSTPPQELWKPLIEELLRDGVVTNVSDGSEFVMTEVGSNINMKEIEAGILKLPLYQALKKYEPKTYSEILAEMQKGFRGEVNKSEMRAITLKKIVKVYLRYLPRSDDEALVQIIEILIEQIKQTMIQNPDVCYALLFPQFSNTIDPSSYMSAELKNRELEAMARIIETAITNPQAIPTASEVRHTQERLYQALAKTYGKDVELLSSATSPGVHKGKVCSVTAALYQEILKLPRKEATKILRYMFRDA